MANAALTTLIGVVAGAAALLPAIDVAPAQSATITYNFEVNVTEGNYLGKYNGNFSFEDSVLTNNGDEIITQANGNLSLLFTFLNKTYTIQDELEFPAYPGAYFRNGQLLGLSFLVVPPKSDPGFFFNGDKFSVGHRIDSRNVYQGDLIGLVTYWLKPSDPPPDPTPCEDDGSCAAVPEPSGGLASLGFLGLGLWMRRKTTR